MRVLKLLWISYFLLKLITGAIWNFLSLLNDILDDRPIKSIIIEQNEFRKLNYLNIELLYN